MSDQSTRERRKRILAGDADALNEVQKAWLDVVNQQYAALLDGESIGPESPSASPLTYLLAAVCDIGPANIDPTPLTATLTLLQNLRLRSQGKFADQPRPATDAEMEALGSAIAASIPVLNRMTHAWVALEGKEPPPAADDDVALTPAEQDIVDVVRENNGVKSQAELFDLLSAKGKNPSTGTTKIYCANLVRRGIIRPGHRRRGYLP